MKIPRGRYFAKTSELLTLLIDTLFTFNLPSTEDIQDIDNLTKKFLTNNQPFLFVPSFRIGLYYTLKTLKKKYPQKNKVITTSITIPDTINAIRINKLQDIFVEMDKNSHGIDINQALSFLKQDVLAIIITHLSGSVSQDLYTLYKECRDRGIIVIEDFSQAYGNEECFKSADISIGSLSTGKTLSTLIGGIITSKDSELINEIVKSNKVSEDCNKTQRSMIIFQIIDSLKINFFCNRYIFNWFTYYALKIFKYISPSSYSKLEQARTITRALNQDRFFENSFTHRSSFPEFFFFKITKAQLHFYRQMLIRFKEGNQERRDIFNQFYEQLETDIQKSIPSNFITNSNNTYYHIPINTHGKRDEIQNDYFQNGVDISSYGLPLCHTFFSDKNLPQSESIKYDTLFIPINEFSTSAEIKKIANITNRIYRQLKETSETSLAPSSGNSN